MVMSRGGRCQGASRVRSRRPLAQQVRILPGVAPRPLGDEVDDLESAERGQVLPHVRLGMERRTVVATRTPRAADDQLALEEPPLLGGRELGQVVFAMS